MAWLEGWTYRRAITVTAGSNGMPANYQVKVVVDTASLISAGKMRSDGGDIRFTKSDGVTLLSYWIESGINTTSTVIWVKDPDALSANASHTIYMYYGNPNATSQANGDAVFELFDDFNDNSINTSKWEVKRGGGSSTVYEQNQEIEVYSDGTYRAYLKSIQSFSAPYRLVVYGKKNENIEIAFHWDGVIGTYYYLPANGYTYRYIAWETTKVFRLEKWVSSSTTNLGDYTYTLDTAWYRYEIILKPSGTTITAKIDTTTTHTSTDTTRTSGYIGLTGREKLGTGAGYVSYYDNLFVTKYVDPEPTITVGSEAVYYTLSLTENLGLLDTIPKQVSLLKTELLGLTDAPSKQVSIFKYEGLGLSDTLEYLKAKFVELIERLGLSDSFTRKQEAYRTFTERLGLSDSYSRTFAGYRTLHFQFLFGFK